MEKLRDPTDDSPGLYRVTGLMNDGSEVVDEYNTVTGLIKIAIFLIKIKKNPFLI